MGILHNMDMATVRSIVTVVAFLTFLGIVFWAYSGAQKSRFEAAARLPFDEDDNLNRGERR
jgi:cytochrome c oxidase cbb3-type subunit 4